MCVATDQKTKNFMTSQCALQPPFRLPACLASLSVVLCRVASFGPPAPVQQLCAFAAVPPVAVLQAGSAAATAAHSWR